MNLPNALQKMDLTPGKLILLGAVFIVILLDIYLMLSGQEHFSATILKFHTDHLWIGLAIGIVGGHLLWPQMMEVPIKP